MLQSNLKNYLQTTADQYGIQETLKKSIISRPHDHHLCHEDYDATEIINQNINPNISLKNLRFGLKPSVIDLRHKDYSVPNRLNTQPEYRSLDQVAEFELLDVLGKGGMGTIYEGIQKSLNRVVAIKQSKLNIQLLPQIYHEAQISAFLDHPNILTVHDFGVDHSGFPVQIMKKIDGITWSTLLYDSHHDFWQSLDIENDEDTRLLFHLDVLSKVSQAIDYAHQKQIIHRDLKPENIMIGKFGEVFILDWGIALYLGDQEDLFIAQKHSNLKNLLVGTPAYMAPEQANLSIPPSTAIDIYLLAAILYEIIHLKTLHQGDCIEDLLINISQNRLPPIADHLNNELKILLYTSLKTDPSERLQTARLFRKQLQIAISSFKSKQLELKGLKAFETFKRLLIEEKNSMGVIQIDRFVLSQEEQRRENEIDDYFDKARLYLTSSLDLFDKNDAAKTELQALLVLWITRCTQKHDFRQAYRYLKELPFYQSNLEFAIHDTKYRLEIERKKIQALKEWQDNLSVQKSKWPRFYFALFCFIFLGLGSISIYVLSLYGKYQDSAKSRFLAVFFLSLMSVICSEVWFYFKSQKQQLNQAFYNFKNFIYMVFIFVTISRLIGWQVHNQVDFILLHEMPLASFATFTMGILLKKNDFLFGGICFSLCSILAMIFPLYTSLLYAIAQFTLWSSVLFIYVIEIRQQTEIKIPLK